MTPTQWLKGILVHSALAFAVFSLWCAGLERLLPGFVTPFLNIPLLLLFAGALTLTAAAISRAKEHVAARIGSIIFLGVGLAAAGGFFWTRILGQGMSGLLLFGGAALAAALMIAALAASDAT